MDSQVGRVNTWRQQKRDAGYQPMTIWIKADIKHRIEDLAAQRRQDLGEVITVAIQAWDTSAHQAAVDARSVREQVAEALAALAPGLLSHAPPAAVAAAPLTPTATLLPGERGAQIQAIRTAAPLLGRFTCAAMAQHIGAKPKNIQGSLRSLIASGALIKTGTVYFWAADAHALLPSATLLPGERGALTQAVRAAAPQLRRFTCTTMATHVGAKATIVNKTLAWLVAKGELVKKGTVYFWVDTDTPQP